MDNAEIVRCAWIDHTQAYDGMFGLQVMARGVEITGSKTLDDFLKEHDLNDFSVLLYHSGRETPRIKWLIDNYPKLNVALMTLGGSFETRKIGDRRVVVLPYIENMVYNFIKEHQSAD